jgi:hypothetical protein
MSDGIDQLIAVLDEQARDLNELANDARDLCLIQVSRDTEDFFFHRVEIIASEIALFRKQLQELMKRS